MAKSQIQERSGRGETITLRATLRQKTLIDQAAASLGRSRSQFMIETICREAEAVLLDRRSFAVSEEAFMRFTAMLDKPPKDNPELRRLLEARPPW